MFVGLITEGNFSWDMKVELSIQNDDEECPEYTKGVLYLDEDYAYYDRAHTICSDTYYLTYRFPRELFAEVLIFISKSSPVFLECYLNKMDNAEIIEMQHSL